MHIIKWTVNEKRFHEFEIEQIGLYIKVLDGGKETKWYNNFKNKNNV